MLTLFKIKKSKKIDQPIEVEEVLEEVEDDLHIEYVETLPPINIFISVDQLSVLNEVDEDREMQAKMFLNSKKMKDLDASHYNDFKLKFEKSFSKLGNTNNQCPHCRREYTSAPAEVKKCLGCGKAFFKAKRPQDGETVLVRDENRELMALQWENIKKAELIERVNLDELEKVRLKLESRDNRRYSIYNAHFTMLRQYTAKALTSGRFRLYSSLIYYMAEHDRYEKDFAKALTYYFYLYYLQLNGVSNSVVFGDKVSVNIRIIKRISSLLRMINVQTTQCAEFFEYSIEKNTAFEAENFPYDIEQTYAHLVKSFEKEEGREIIPELAIEKTKPKSFRLQK